MHLPYLSLFRTYFLLTMSTHNSFFLTKKYIKFYPQFWHFLHHILFSNIASNKLYNFFIFSSSGNTSTVLPTFFVGGSIFSIFCSTSTKASCFLGSTLISIVDYYILARFIKSLSDIFFLHKKYRQIYHLQ